jgi:MipA family protein
MQNRRDIHSLQPTADPMPIALSRALRCAVVAASLCESAPAHADLLEGLQDLLSGHHEWEGAIGAVAGFGPAYLASDDYGVGIKPALFLRYGRFSLNTGAGFTTRRADQMLRGLGVDLFSGERFKVALSGRLDNGRSASSSPALAGMGDVDGTVRVRVTGTWRLDEGWKLGAAASVDVLGRGQGALGELSFVREHVLTPELLWSWGGSLTFGDGTYMQSYYGVTPEQSANSGYPVYTPSTGLRDVALSTGLTAELAQDWVGFVNVGVSQALGPVKDSPLSFKPLGYGVNTGVAWRF